MTSMTDHHEALRAQLMEGCVCHEDRWPGDTHDDLGGPVNEGATNLLMQQAAAAIAALTPPVDAWQPIETAPSGRAVLVAYKNVLGKYRIVKAEHFARFTVEAHGDDVSSEGCDEYDEPNDRFTYCEGWWELIDNWDDFAFVGFDSDNTPTHWMPLPTPPQPESPA